MLIRAEEQRDWDAVHSVNGSAFETPAEANLVDALREKAQPLVSLIAEDRGAIVGHVMFSPVSLSGHPALKIMGLAPMAVTPEHQRKGIGSALVRAGFEQCKQLGFGAVVVLGHPAYYPRFGFSSSTRFGIWCLQRNSLICRLFGSDDTLGPTNALGSWKRVIRQQSPRYSREVPVYVIWP